MKKMKFTSLISQLETLKDVTKELEALIAEDPVLDQMKCKDLDEMADKLNEVVAVLVLLEEEEP